MLNFSKPVRWRKQTLHLAKKWIFISVWTIPLSPVCWSLRAPFRDFSMPVLLTGAEGANLSWIQKGQHGSFSHEVEKAPSARRTRDPDPAKHNAPPEPCLMSYTRMNRAACSINHQPEMSVTCGMLLFLHTYVCTPCVCIHVSQCAPMCRAGHTHTCAHSPLDTQSPPGRPALTIPVRWGACVSAGDGG